MLNESLKTLRFSLFRLVETAWWLRLGLMNALSWILLLHPLHSLVCSVQCFWWLHPLSWLQSVFSEYRWLCHPLVAREFAVGQKKDFVDNWSTLSAYLCMWQCTQTIWNRLHYCIFLLHFNWSNGCCFLLQWCRVSLWWKEHAQFENGTFFTSSFALLRDCFDNSECMERTN